VNAFEDSEKLDAWTVLSESNPSPKPGHIHIIVVTQRDSETGHHPIFMMTDTSQGTFPAIPTGSVLDRRRLCNAFFSKPPSTTGQPAEFRKLQSRSPPAFFFNRPPEAAAVTPLTLLHPVFGKFVQDCDTLCPTPEDNQFVLTVWREMSGFFKEEKDRAAAFRRLLAGYGIDMAVSAIGSYQTDGDLRIKGLCFAIVEAKPELASGQADPLFQAASYYVASMRTTSEKYPNARLPSILIYLFGQLPSIWLCGTFSDMHVQGLISGLQAQSTQMVPVCKFSVLFCLYFGMRPTSRCTKGLPGVLVLSGT
jgi:hypothetical protein